MGSVTVTGINTRFVSIRISALGRISFLSGTFGRGRISTFCWALDQKAVPTTMALNRNNLR